MNLGEIDDRQSVLTMLGENVVKSDHSLVTKLTGFFDQDRGHGTEEHQDGNE